MKKYPGRYKAVRYVDFVKNPMKINEEVFKFYKIPLHRDVLQFVLSNSQDTGLRWMKGLPGREILEIQDKCADATEALGYNLVKEGEDMDKMDENLTIGHFEL
jgi:hypothetical protein